MFVYAGTGAKLTIAAGVILTLKQRVYQHDVNGALFAGPGGWLWIVFDTHLAFGGAAQVSPWEGCCL